MRNIELLAMQARTAFVLDSTGAMLTVNEPVALQARAPLVYAASAADDSTLILGRADVPAGVLLDVRRALELALPFEDRRAAVERTGLEFRRMERGLSWLIGTLPVPVAVGVLWSGSEAGDRLVARYAGEGMPAAMAEAGFVGVEDFWAPWCAVMVEGVVASIAFAARISEEAADIGLYTMSAHRKRGLGTAAVAAWANHPDLAGRTLFYAADWENFASHRVAERLGLRPLGFTVSIS